jgi:hypothetical protein
VGLLILLLLLLLLLLTSRGRARLSLLCSLLLVKIVGRCGAGGLSWRLEVVGYIVWSLRPRRRSSTGSSWVWSLELAAGLLAKCRSSRLGAQWPLILLRLVIAIAIVAAVVHVPRWLYWSGRLRSRVRLRAREAHAWVGVVLLLLLLVLLLLRREWARGRLVATPGLFLICGDFIVVVVRICVATWAIGRGRVAHRVGMQVAGADIRIGCRVRGKRVDG